MLNYAREKFKYRLEENRGEEKFEQDRQTKQSSQ